MLWRCQSAREVLRHRATLGEARTWHAAGWDTEMSVCLSVALLNATESCVGDVASFDELVE